MWYGNNVNQSMCTIVVSKLPLKRGGVGRLDAQMEDYSYWLVHYQDMYTPESGHNILIYNAVIKLRQWIQTYSFTIVRAMEYFVFYRVFLNVFKSPEADFF